MKKTELHASPAASLSEADVSGIIAMAWQDDTPFEAIASQFGLTEPDVIALMRAQLKTRSFRVWRMRVRGRAAKHLALQQGLFTKGSGRSYACEAGEPGCTGSHTQAAMCAGSPGNMPPEIIMKKRQYKLQRLFPVPASNKSLLGGCCMPIGRQPRHGGTAAAATSTTENEQQLGQVPEDFPLSPSSISRQSLR